MLVKRKNTHKNAPRDRKLSSVKVISDAARDAYIYPSPLRANQQNYFSNLGSAVRVRFNLVRICQYLNVESDGMIAMCEKLENKIHREYEKRRKIIVTAENRSK